MTDFLWTADDVLTATGGRLIGDDFHANGFAMDSRDVTSGDIFIALIPETEGDKYRTSGQDGHNFIQSAVDNGAVAVIVSRDMGCDVPQILVKDTTQAMSDLAEFSRTRAPLKHVIGITGSVGKTGTRDMVETAFQSTSLKIHASIKSYNNAIGVPFTLVTMPATTDILISEMGMNQAGEISNLTALARPTMAIITWISEQHIGNFADGMDGIVKAKSEIFEGVAEDGLAILPRDNDYYDDLVANAKGLKIYSFGDHQDADARLISCALTPKGTMITANIMGENVSYNMPILGRHNAMNSLSALLAIKLAGHDVQTAAKSLIAIRGVEGRGRLERIGDITLIDDSYNAAPAAMVAAFKVLKDIKTSGRKIAILGYMGELGDYARDMHESLAEPLLMSGIDKLYCCGADMKYLYDLMPADKQGAFFETSDDIAVIIGDILHPNDLVLVKGSLGSHLKVVIEAMRKMDK